MSALPSKRTFQQPVGCPLRANSERNREPTCALNTMRLLDYVSNFILWTYKYDLIFSDEEFIRFHFWHFLQHEGREVVQSDIGWQFVANPNLFHAGNLLDMHVLKIFFNDVALLC